MNDDLVVIPTYNEALNIEPLVNRVLRSEDFSTLIVDDNSPDGTGRIANALAARHPERVSVLHRQSKDGLGAAYRAGFEMALARGPARVYQMDADLSHDPAVLNTMRAALVDGNDVVIGSRYTRGGGVEGWPWWRQALSRGGSLYAGKILRLSLRDLTGGFKGWRRDVLQAIDPGETRSDGYAFQIETTYRALLAGARVTEVPIRFTDRRRGVSKMGLPIFLEAVRVVPALRLRHPQLSRVAHRRPGSARSASPKA